MASEISVTRASFTAYFELIADGKSFPLGQVARDFIMLRSPGTIPAGPGEFVVRCDTQPEIHHQIEIIWPGPCALRADQHSAMLTANETSGRIIPHVVANDSLNGKPQATAFSMGR